MIARAPCVSTRIQSMLRLGEPGLALMLPKPESGLRDNMLRAMDQSRASTADGMQLLSVSCVGGAGLSALTSSGSLGNTGSIAVLPAIAVKMHFTTGAAAFAPKPLFSRYATTVYGF